MSRPTQVWLHRFACFTAFATLLLLVAGALVTSHRAGLAVPDWPTTYGHFMYSFPVKKWVGNIFWEHSHRVIASTVGILTIIVCVWLLRAEPRRWMRRLGLIALAAVVAQGILGGITVKFFLPPAVSVAHAALAQAFFCITIALAFFTKPSIDSIETAGALGFRRFAVLTTGTVYLQLILGAFIRHADAGVLIHIAVAALVLAGAFAQVFFAARLRLLLVHAMSVAFLVTLQIGLGVATLIVRVPKDVQTQLAPAQVLLPTAHLIVGALILGLNFALTLRSFRQPMFSGAAKYSWLSAYIELTKPRIVSMVLVTTALGFFLGGKGLHSPLKLMLLLFGTACAAGGAAVLNNYLEREIDAKMERTKHRALPAGIVLPATALSYGIVLLLAGVVLLAWKVNLLTGFLVLLAAFLYVVVYTPMKRITWLNTAIGAVPGAIPPLSGWAAATGQLDLGAWVLFLILFAWQQPHFYAIAWMFKDDYRNAGLKMLPVVDPSGARTFRQIIAFSAALLGASLLPTWIGMTGRIYFAGALVIGLALLAAGVWMTRGKSFADARRLLRVSVIYLPILLMLIIIDVGF
jgi:protoheme IX farnesyltransferase